MAAVLDKKDPAAKFDSQVDEQLAQATSRIRVHDIAFGGLLLVAIVLCYTTAMVVLDKYFVLPEWVRQAALAGFFAILATTAYFTLISPMRKRINPLYAARQVERTIDDAKNSVTGYVDAQQKGDLNATVKAALASRAAKAAAEADVNRAVDHRSLLYLGGIAIAFLLTLVVLFLIFRPAQFASLVGRAYVPFSSDPIATRTQLKLVKPEPAEPTITTGQSITVAVHVGGKVPSTDSPDRVRLLVRHNPADPNYEEIPMVQGETTRDWELRVPDYLVQNGFWYKVAGGDNVTPEYKVTVRSLPVFTDFQTTYDYPKYLRRKSETANDPVIRAYRGTTVTLVAKTNREVRDGLMEITPGNVRVLGTAVPGKPDSLQFVFKLTESGKYKLTLNAVNGEHNADPFQSNITVDADQEPKVVINKPEQDETTAPANGQITVDGKVGDDFGIDTVTLKMKIVKPVERPLPDVPYLNGKSPSFRREDDTWPTDLDYKGSVDLAKLTKDAAGLKLELTEGTVIEYWLEATDNCTEPKPNVGRSQPKRVTLTPPKMAEMDKQELDQQKETRQNEEQQHNKQQQQKFQNEKRDQNQKNGGQQQPKPENNPESKPGEKGDKPPQGKPPANQGNQPENKQPNDQGPKPGEGPKPPEGSKPGEGPKPPDGPKPPEGQKPPDKNEPKGMAGMGDMGNPMPKNPNDPQPMNPDKPQNMGGMGGTGQQNNPDKNVEKTADEFQKEIENENKSGASAKPNPTPNEKDRADPGQAKPQPKDGMNGMGGAADASAPKPAEPKQPNDPMNPMGKNDGAPATSKPEGNVEKAQDPATPKPEPKQQPNGTKGQKNTPAENRSEPFGGAPGTDKETPKEPQPAPKDPNTKQDPGSGSQAKPATQKKDGNAGGMPDGGEKQDPAGKAASKPKPPVKDPTRGADKPSEQQQGDPKPGPKPENKPDDKPSGGEAKPEKGPPAGGAKPKPKEDMMGEGMDADPKPADGANNPMKPNGTGSAEAKPDDKNQTPMGGSGVEKGMDKPKAGDEKGNQKAGSGDKPSKLDEKQLKELEDAAKDLTSSDPKKKEDARKKLDKAIGKEKREELEKLANDLNSPDKGKREAAEQKLRDLKKQMDKAAGKDAEKDQPQLTQQQLQELTDALNDLKSDDPNKRQQAQQKLDKMLGEGKRKEIEQFMDDLKSNDKDKQAAAQKKLDDLKKKMDKAAKKNKKNDLQPKEPSPEDVADIMKKAQDLNSDNGKAREQAEQALDEKIGPENRKKLQEEMKNKKPGEPPTNPEQLKKQMEEWQQGPGSGTQNKGPMEEDKKNRLKTAEFNLEKFESDKYREQLQKMKGWTDAEYDEFLKGYRKYIENLRKEVAAGNKPATAPMPSDPAFTPGSAGRIAPTGPAGTSNADVGGPTVAPPGFEDAKLKFERALKKKP